MRRFKPPVGGVSLMHLAQAEMQQKKLKSVGAAAKPSNSNGNAVRAASSAW